MAVHVTSGSTFKVGSPLAAVNGLASLTFNHNRTTIDITELGYDFKKYLLGQSDSSATVEVFFDHTAGQADLEGVLNAAGTGSPMEYTAHTGAQYQFTGIVTSINYSSPVNDVVKATIEIKVISAVTIV
jgi:predicted secreted protein